MLDIYSYIKYFYFMIKSFKDRETEKIFNQEYSRKLPRQIQYRALKKLILINSAEKEDDLMVPFSNHFEHLKEKEKMNVQLE